jgi:hypothetical protein
MMAADLAALGASPDGDSDDAAVGDAARQFVAGSNMPALEAV